jgi:hypothetical protein
VRFLGGFFRRTPGSTILVDELDARILEGLSNRNVIGGLHLRSVRQGGFTY